MKNLSKRITAAVLALLMAAGAGTSSLPFLSGTDTSITASAEDSTPVIDPDVGDKVDPSDPSGSVNYSINRFYEIYTDLLAGAKYTVHADMIQATSSSKSMSDNAIDHDVVLSYENGQIYVTVNFVPLNLLGKKGYLKTLYYYNKGYTINSYGVPQGAYSEAEVLETYSDIDQYNGKDKDGAGNYTSAKYLYPKTLKFPLVDGASKSETLQKVPLGVYVPVMAAINPSSGYQEVYMQIDWSTAKKKTSGIQPETSIKFPFIPAGDSYTSTRIYPNATDEEVQQLKNGVYTVSVKADTDCTASKTGKLAKYLDNKVTVLVVNGKYYLITGINTPEGSHDFKTLYVGKKESMLEYRYKGSGNLAFYDYDGGLKSADYIERYMDRIDDSNGYDEDESGNYTKASFYYAKKVGFELPNGKTNNGWQYLTMSNSYMSPVVEYVGDEKVTSYSSRSSQFIYAIDWTSAEQIEDWTVNANYTAVDEALAKVPKDLSKYTDKSAAALTAAVNAVERGLDASEQARVDEMAKAINDAIAALEEKLADGKYTVTADMIKLNKTDKSMSDGAINHTVQIDVVDGEYYATMQFRGLAISNNYGFLKDLSYYDKGYKFENGKLTGTVLPAEVLKTQKYDDGSDYIDQYNDKDNLYPQTVKFKLVDKADSEYVPLQVFVPIMEAISTGNGTQNVFMKIDWSTLKKTDKDVEQDPPIKQPPVFDAADEATGVSAHADKGVLPEGAKLVVTPVTSGSDMDNAKKALDGTARDFDLYDISFTDASGEPVTPNGIVNVSLPVNKAFTDQLGVYRIKDDGSKVAMSGEAKDGSYTFAFKSEQNIKAALADKAEKTAENAIVRYAGKNRYATAAEISKNSFNSADNVVLAYGLDSADALAGVSLAAKLKAPLLLTSKDKLPSETVDEIKRLGAKNVTILGGTGAISDDVKAAIEKIGVKTERIAGSTRFGTATAIAEKLSSEPEEIFFVYAFNYPDALSASAVAAIKNAPVIYLKTGGDIDADTAKYLEKVKGKVKNAYVIGGDKVITDDMMKKAGDALGLETGKTITRISGKNRFETCIAVNNAFKDVLTGKAISVATGVDFPDALAGGVFAAMNKTPLFLTGKTLDEQQLNYLNSRKASSIFVFGGTGAVSDDAAKQIAKTTL